MGSGLGPTGAAGGLGAGVPEDVAAHPSFHAPTCAISSGRVASPPFPRRPASLPAEGYLPLIPRATVESHSFYRAAHGAARPGSRNLGNRGADQSLGREIAGSLPTRQPGALTPAPGTRLAASFLLPEAESGAGRGSVCR